MRFNCLLIVTLLGIGLHWPSHALTIDFEGLPFPNHPLHYNGDDLAGGFEVEGARFNNHFTDYGGGCCWEGFAYSRETEIPPLETSQFLWSHQYTAFPGIGSGGSANYAVAFSGIDAGEGGLVPLITLPAGGMPESIDVTNTVFTALSVRNGDGFGKKFGGEEGTDPDWFRMDIVGLDAQENELARVEFYLADFRDGESLIVDTWETLDLAPLALSTLASLAVRFDSSDRTSQWLNTPAYAALDNLVLNFPIAGDYNGDGTVDAADYTVWRNTLGSTEILAADGNRNGQVDTDDYLLWKQAFGNSAHGLPTNSPIPEPSIAGLLLAASLLIYVFVR